MPDPECADVLLDPELGSEQRQRAVWRSSVARGVDEVPDARRGRGIGDVASVAGFTLGSGLVGRTGCEHRLRPDRRVTDAGWVIEVAIHDVGSDVPKPVGGGRLRIAADRADRMPAREQHIDERPEPPGRAGDHHCPSLRLSGHVRPGVPRPSSEDRPGGRASHA